MEDSKSKNSELLEYWLHILKICEPTVKNPLVRESYNEMIKDVERMISEAKRRELTFFE